MEKEKNKNLQMFFGIAFAILTFMLWLPVGYGSYGEASIIFGLPSWAFIALTAGIIFVILQWIFFFNSNLSTNDDDVQRILNDILKKENK
jgi:hypothetical protein